MSDVRRTRWRADVLLSVSLFILVSCLSLTPAVHELNQRFTDSYFRVSTSERPSDVVVVSIDDATLQKFGRWPWPRTTLATLVRAISAQKPRVVGIDILLSEPQSDRADVDFREALASGGNVFLVDKIATFPDGPRWMEPIPEFARAAAGVGHAEAVLDSDGVCRRFPPEELSLSGPRYAFAIEVARYIARPEADRFMSRYGVSYANGGERVLLAKPLLIPIPFRSDPIETVSAAEVFSGAKPERLRNKVVLVGFGAVEIGDRITTPVSRGLPTPGVEIHAQIVDAILSGKTMQPVSSTAWVFLILAVCFVTVQLFRRWRGWKALPLLVIFVAAVYLGGLAGFRVIHSTLPSGTLLLAGLLAPPMIFGVELAAVEGSIARQMRLLQKWLAYRREGDSLAASDLSWRLDVLTDLQEELGLRFELYRSLLESTRDLVAVFDADGSLQFANQAFTRTWHGIFPGSLKEVRKLLVESKDAPINLSGNSLEGEATFKGSLYSVRLVPLPATSLTPKGGTLLSMTSLHMRLERDRAREEALGFVTHELRTPLVAIQGFAEMMARYPNSPASSRAPETIVRESRRLLAVINSYLDVLRTDAGARPLRSEEVQVNQTIAQVFDLLSPLAQASSIRLVMQCREDLLLSADEPLLTGAILNLVSNAIKYGLRDSEVSVSAKIDGAELELRVHNVGAPIPPGEIATLFASFARGKRDEARIQGWGLGLSFVKRIVEKHGGMVSVESDSETGTTFVVRMPGATVAVRQVAGSS